jgi:hypothetical protein
MVHLVRALLAIGGTGVDSPYDRLASVPAVAADWHHNRGGICAGARGVVSSGAVVGVEGDAVSLTDRIGFGPRDNAAARNNMEHILLPDKDGIQYGNYLNYLETIRKSLPEPVYQFASSEQHFNLNSPHSLHDAWMESVTISEQRQKTAPFKPQVQVILKLLGQQHDRMIVLEYDKVSRYTVEGKQNDFNWADTFHGDVFTHEIRVTNENKIIHEILFCSDSRLLVECENFTHREELQG